MLGRPVLNPSLIMTLLPSMLRVPIYLLAALASCGGETNPTGGPTPDDLVDLGWDMTLDAPEYEPCAYRVKVKAMDSALELDGQGYVERSVSPAGTRLPGFWQEEQSMIGIACPGPSIRAFVTIRQTIVDGVRKESASAVEIDASYTPYDGDAVRWHHVTRIDLSRSQTLTGDGFAVTVERRPN